MKPQSWIGICGAALMLTTGTAAMAQDARQPQPSPIFNMPRMTLKSAAFEDGGIIPDKHTQAIASPVSPALAWDEVPPGVWSFALIMTDMDTAMGGSSSGALHWLMFNIPGSARSTPEGMPATQVLPDGTVQGRNIRKFVGYRGPGAPATVPHHHYSFELYALDTLLDLGPEATRAEILAAMQGHVVAKATTIGKFRQRSAK